MIDKETQERLRAKYNPNGSPLRCHQLKLVEMLNYLDEVCRKHNISYWLSSGTCLGAVRHGGFIPWDDDMDVEMMREDYLRLLDVFKETDNYVIQTWKNDHYYNTVFGKMRDKHSVVYDSLYKYQGIFIDLFALEYTKEWGSYMLHHLPCMSRPYEFCKKHRNNKWLFKLGTLVFNLTKLIHFGLIPATRVICKPLRGKQLRHQYGVGFIKKIRNESDIFPLTGMLFEGRVFPVPGNYDGYLTKIYGDWRKLPPEEEQQAPHVQEFSLNKERKG